MPKSKEMISSSESGSGSESEEETKSKSKSKAKKEQKKVTSESDNSESDDDSKSKKRSKKMKDNKNSKKAKKDEKDSDDTWDLGNNKKIAVREFKGRWFVDIRETYLDKASGEFKPGKKGICMNFENWRALYKVADEVNKRVEAKSS